MNKTTTSSTSAIPRLSKDIQWLLIWTGAIAVLGIWDIIFLNKPAFKQVCAGFANTFLVATMVIVFSLAMGWAVTMILHFLDMRKQRAPYLLITFFLNLIRSVPQIVGVLFGYVFIAMLIEKEILRSDLPAFVLMAFTMSLFIFGEVVDLMRERIEHYRRLDFYNALQVCGVSENRIVNFDILWKNSRVHILNKLISILGIAVFLQCSVDFIISVGLSTNVSSVNLPLTLGSLLAKIDSKQDILAIGYTLTHPAYAHNLLFNHLQGVTVAFVIVFTLLSIYNISNGYTEKHRL